MSSRPAMSRGSYTTEQRAELLARADAGELIELAERCIAELGEPTVLVAPEIGLVMLQVREPVCEERFHLGEVVVTRCEVQLGGSLGWCMRPGVDRIAALAAAVCDAVAGNGGSLAAEVLELCGRTADAHERARNAEWAALAPTEVTFEELE